VIAHHDSFAVENLKAIEKLLTDDNDWVRLNAAGAVAQYGAKAKSALPALKACLERKDEGLKQRAKESIAEIEAAKDDPDRERRHAATVAKINEYIAAHKPR
jgi:HEAT repeat protein